MIGIGDATHPEWTLEEVAIADDRGSDGLDETCACRVHESVTNLLAAERDVEARSKMPLAIAAGPRLSRYRFASDVGASTRPTTGVARAVPLPFGSPLLLLIYRRRFEIQSQ